MSLYGQSIQAIIADAHLLPPSDSKQFIIGFPISVAMPWNKHYFMLEVKALYKSNILTTSRQKLQFDAAPGEIVSLTATKNLTLLADMLAGLRSPDQGQILLNSLNVHAGDTRDRIAYIPANPAVNPATSLRDNIKILCRKTADINDLTHIEQDFYGGLLDTVTTSSNYTAVQWIRLRILVAMHCKKDLLIIDDTNELLFGQACRDIRQLLKKAASTGMIILIICAATQTAYTPCNRTVNIET